MRTAAQHYRIIRRNHPTMPASQAILWARSERRLDEMESRCEWDFIGEDRTIAIGTIDGADIVVYVDDEPYDWGDDEPTDQERRDLEVIGVGVRIAGEDDDLDSIWSVSYLDGDWERAALSAAWEFDFIETAARELANRADAAARDIVTVA